MTEIVETVVLEILKKIQDQGAATRRDLAALQADMNAFRDDMNVFREDMSAFRDDMNSFRTETNVRLTALETSVRKQRRDIAGILVIGKALAGDLDERISEVEARMIRMESIRR